jgi:hypothetical protein
MAIRKRESSAMSACIERISGGLAAHSLDIIA